MRFIVVFILFLVSGSAFSQMLTTGDVLKKITKYTKKDDFASAISILKDTTNYKFDQEYKPFIYQEIVSIYNKWGKKLKMRGLYDEADIIYKTALEDCKYSNRKEKDTKATILNYCDLLLTRDLYDTALEVLESGDFTKTDKTNYLRFLLRKAEIYFYKGLYKEALAMFSVLETYPLEANIRLEEVCNKAFLLMEMATVYNNIEYLRNADSLYSSALTFIMDEYNIAIINSNLSVIKARLGYFDEAIRLNENAKSWFKKNLNRHHRDYIITIRKKAEILLLMKGAKAALSAFKDYYKEEKEYVINQFDFFTEQQRIDYWKNKKGLISEIFELEFEDPNFLFDVALFRRQVALLSRNDSSNIAQKLSVSKDIISQNLGKKDIAIEFVKYEKGNKNRYAALLLSGTDKKNVRFIPLWLENSIKTYNIGGNRLDSALCSKVRADKDKVYQNESLSAFVWDKLLPFIPEGSTIYFAPDGILHLLAIEYLPSVNNGKYELHRLTTTALLAEKKKKTKRSSTKALVVGGMDYNFIAPRDKSRTTSANKDAFRYLLQNKKLMHFTYLPGSKVETDSIIKYLSGIDRYEDIDESSLKNKMGNYGKVHLATHGYSWHVDVPSVPYAFRDSITEDKSLLASGIALSGANELYRFPLRDDGLLSARELCEMDLTGVELVIASSCQSAQGRVSDEGPTGLVRGLKKAGVRTIIASLWPVSDKATMLLMQFFYDEWRESKGKDGKGCSKTHALHLAQGRLKEIEGDLVKIRTYNSSRKTGDYKTVTTKFDSPFYWAPFIIIDDI